MMKIFAIVSLVLSFAFLGFALGAMVQSLAVHTLLTTCIASAAGLSIGCLIHSVLEEWRSKSRRI